MQKEEIIPSRNFQSDHDSLESIGFILSWNRVWRKKLLILRGTGIVTLSAAIIMILMPNIYQSKGFLKAGIPSSTYAKEVPLLTDPLHFLSFLKESKFPLDEFTRLQSRLMEGDPRVLENMIGVSYEVRTPGIGAAGQGDVIGFWLTGEDRSPKGAQELTVGVGNYLKDCLLRDALYDRINSRYLELVGERTKAENSVYQNAIMTQLLATKREEVRRIEKNYPSTTIAINQVFHAKGESNQYESPLSKIVEIELEIADSKMKQAQKEEEAAAARIELDFLTKAMGFLSNRDLTGNDLLQKLLVLKDQYFKTIDSSKNPARQALNAIASSLDEVNTDYASASGKIRFATWPTLPRQPAKPQRARIIFDSFFLSVIGLLVLVLLLT